VICVSEVQGFSAWKAIANVATTVALFAAPLYLLYWLS